MAAAGTPQAPARGPGLVRTSTPPRRYGYGPGFGPHGGYYGPGYGYRGWGGYWGAPYFWAPGVWWYGPAYIGSLDQPYYYAPGAVDALDAFGPRQIYSVALRSTELQPNQRVAGLAFFEPAWAARLVTLRFDAKPRGAPPVELATRFEVSK